MMVTSCAGTGRTRLVSPSRAKTGCCAPARINGGTGTELIGHQELPFRDLRGGTVGQGHDHVGANGKSDQHEKADESVSSAGAL